LAREKCSRKPDARKTFEELEHAATELRRDNRSAGSDPPTGVEGARTQKLRRSVAIRVGFVVGTIRGAFGM
jgi:hypothetical protein